MDVSIGWIGGCMGGCIYMDGLYIHASTLHTQHTKYTNFNCE